MSNDQIKAAVLSIVDKYNISRATLFGSRASGTNREDSDVDLIVEFSCRVSLLTLSELTTELEEILELEVDVVHGPIREDDMIEIHDEVLLYAA